MSAAASASRSASARTGTPLADAAARAPVPRLRVRLDGGADPQATASWRMALAPLFTIEVDGDAAAFRGELDAVHLGDSLISRCSASVAHAFRRGAGDIRRSQVDHILIQCYLAGAVEGDYGGRQVHAATGSVSVLDLGRALDSRAGAFSNLTLVVPRDHLPLSLRRRDLHGAVLEPARAATRLLGSHLAELLEHGADLTPEEMAAGVRAALVLLEGGAAALDDGMLPAQTAARRSMRRLVQGYVDAHLCAETLSAAQIARTFRLSRATLYRLFDDDGGVHAYIQGRRLDHCFDELARPHAHPPAIGELAYRYAFSSESAFSRAFRRRFGLSPREVRVLSAHAARPPAGIGVAEAEAGEAALIQAWLAGLRHAGERA
ncbi:helix-turn-helix domain-containing protein [Cupriavidus malaysiensis]|uniref:HTH araC/xylS-type domain-containing protein n=1 Tax=Cupriavidus malaysiensis TaxID=367825 RepID=A0ABN4TV69_9BURK|nr:helix-turn-helix domain-containing protein [Cupriavidus malaysiensis]AOZ10374.1 hypothetical protein BKK80_32835 [Cupriavidus malaysiensis]